jgi:hypothetical protein
MSTSRIRQALRLVRKDLAWAKGNPNRSCWIRERIREETLMICDAADIGIGNKPVVGGGYLAGVGVWWHERHGRRISPMRDL